MPMTGGENIGCIFDKTGQVVINPEFKDVAIIQPGRFSEGLAVQWVHDKVPGTDERWGYIDKTGEMVIEPQFQKAYDFKNGLAFVRADCFDRPKWGYIDKTGHLCGTPLTRLNAPNFHPITLN